VDTAVRVDPVVVADLDAAVEIEPTRVVLYASGSADRAAIDSLTVPIRAVLTVDEAGMVFMDRAAVPIEEVTDVLRRLKERNPGIALLILVPEGSGEDDPGYRLAEIARDLGIGEVTVKKVKK
jgi:hypothetical protein